tara:strand:- start:2387 stop:2593 length:207 start_codon:yes stop_codon:yes gene_type:complete
LKLKKLNPLNYKDMKEQNNNPEFLKYLWRNSLITSKQYFFRLGANQMGIKTYEDRTEKLKQFINQLNK